MKSSQQRRTELKAERQQKTAKKAARAKVERAADMARLTPEHLGAGEAHVNASALAGSSQRELPDFVQRGTYRNQPFRCINCDKAEVWTATQQKWWYEVAKGDLATTAVRCRSCRQRERHRKAEARRIHAEGLEVKKDRRLKTEE